LEKNPTFSCHDVEIDGGITGNNYMQFEYLWLSYVYGANLHDSVMLKVA